MFWPPLLVIAPIFKLGLWEAQYPIEIAIVALESAVSLWHPELDPVDPADVQSNPTPGVHIA